MRPHITPRQKHGRTHGTSRRAIVRRLLLLTFFVVLVGALVFAVLHLLGGRNSKGSEKQPRQLVEKGGERVIDVLTAAKVMWAGDASAERLRLGLVHPEIVSWSPRVIHLHNFLSIEECEALIAMGRPRLAKSTVVDSTTGRSISSQSRTSSGMFLSEDQRKTPLVQAIEERISTFSLTPPVNGEAMQILRYEPGEYYKAHPDFFHDQVNLKRGGQRVATVLMYLEAAEEGGETHFPQVGYLEGKTGSCGGKTVTGLCVRPLKGDAILFWSTRLDGTVDTDSMHESCPVVKGEKWSCTKWIRQREFK